MSREIDLDRALCAHKSMHGTMENVIVGAFFTVSQNSWLGLLPGPGIYKKMYLLHCKSGRPWSQCKGKDL